MQLLHFLTEILFCKKTYLWKVKTRQAKLSSQLVNLCCVWFLLMSPIVLVAIYDLQKLKLNLRP